MPQSRRSSRHLRVVTYNILLGGVGREELIGAVLARADADLVALQEASDPDLVGHLAERLGATAVTAEPSDPDSRLDLVVLSRLPVVGSVNHTHAGMLRTHLEVVVRTGSRALPRVRLDVVHLAARFGERGNGEVRRMREMGHVLADIAAAEPLPHLILGDLNAVAPSDAVAATAFFARLAELRRAGLMTRDEDGFDVPIPRPLEPDPAHDERWRAVGIHPRLDVGISRLPWLVGVATARLPRHPLLDRALTVRIRRDTIAHLLGLGYTDCYRRLNDDDGFTCATWMPAARIDYQLADRELARRLIDCSLIGGDGWPDPDAAAASDHLPVVAEFRLS